MRVLTLGTGWDSAAGGVSTFNRELSIALASTGVDVLARIGERVPPDTSHPQLTVQGLDSYPGVDPAGQLMRSDGLPSHVDLIVGHGRFTGGAAAYLRDHWYRDAGVVHVCHVSPEEGHRHRGDPERAETLTGLERDLIDRADLALTVGPLLAERAERLAITANPVQPTPVAEIVPGIHDSPVAPPRQSGTDHHMLVYGRMDDPLKNIDLAVNVARGVRAEGLPVQLTVRGVAPNELGMVEKQLSKQLGEQVWAKPYTTSASELTQDLLGSDLVLMPSKHEGFGLVATEALGHGVPVLVHEHHSGAGRFLDNLPHRLADSMLVRSPVEARGNVEQWTQKALDLLRDPTSARQQTLALRDYLLGHHSWTDTARTVLRAVNTHTSVRVPESVLDVERGQPTHEQSVGGREYTGAGPVRRARASFPRSLGEALRSQARSGEPERGVERPGDGRSRGERERD